MATQTKRAQNDTYFEDIPTMPLTQAVILDGHNTELLQQRVRTLEDLAENSSILIQQMNNRIEKVEGSYDEDIIYLKRRLRKYHQRHNDYERTNKELEDKVDRVTNIIGKLKDLFQARLRVHTDQILEIINQREKRMRIDMQENFQLLTMNGSRQIAQLHENVDRKWLKQKEYIKSLNNNWTQQMDQVIRHVINSENELKQQMDKDRTDLEIRIVMDHITDTLEFNFVCDDLVHKQELNINRLGELKEVIESHADDITELAHQTQTNERDIEFLCHTILHDDNLPVSNILDHLHERVLTDRHTAQTSRLSELKNIVERNAVEIEELVKCMKKNEKEIEAISRTLLNEDEEPPVSLKDPRIGSNTKWI